MTRTKLTILAGAVAAVAVAAGGVAVAATDALSPKERSQAVIDDAAEQLGVAPSELSDALKQALKNQVDEAVEAGALTEEQGEALKGRIDSADLPLFGRVGVPPLRLDPGYAPHFPPGHLGSLDAAADYLGLTEAELRDALSDGKSLADVARDEGKSVDGLVDALVADVEERIDEAVADGRLTAEQAAEIKQDLRERASELVEREPGARPAFPRHDFFGHEPGFGPRIELPADSRA